MKALAHELIRRRDSSVLCVNCSPRSINWALQRSNTYQHNQSISIAVKRNDIHSTRIGARKQLHHAQHMCSWYGTPLTQLYVDTWVHTGISSKVRVTKCENSSQPDVTLIDDENTCNWRDAAFSSCCTSIMVVADSRTCVNPTDRPNERAIHACMHQINQV
jgi:hypothetical protein